MGISSTITRAALLVPNQSVDRYAKNITRARGCSTSLVTIQQTSAAMIGGCPSRMMKFRQSLRRMVHCRAMRIGKRHRAVHPSWRTRDSRPAWILRRLGCGMLGEVALPFFGSAVGELIVELGQLFDFKVFLHLIGRALEGEAAADQDDELVDEKRVLHHVRGADDGAAGVREIAEERHELKLGRGIQAGTGFVEEEDRWACEEFDGDADPLPLTAGEPPDRQIGAFREDELVHGLIDQPIDLMARRIAGSRRRALY